jgi:hypothetical protein
MTEAKILQLAVPIGDGPSRRRQRHACQGQSLAPPLRGTVRISLVTDLATSERHRRLSIAARILSEIGRDIVSEALDEAA